MVLGGKETEGKEGEAAEAEVVAVEAAPLPAAPYDAMLAEMERSIDDLPIVRRYCADEASAMQLVQALTPPNFGRLISEVNSTFDRADAAGLLGARLGGAMTCAHAAAAIDHADMFKSNMVQKLLPMCSDVQQNKSLITAKLTKWEAVLCEKELGDAV